MKRAIVLSGGGSKGAWGVGVVKALMEQGHTYDVAVGTSTGALMAPFILAEEIDALESGYTSVRQKSIFSKNPFKANGNIRKLRVGTRIIDGKRTLGESENLRDTIERLIRPDYFDKIRAKDRLLGITVANLNLGIAQTKTNKDLSQDGTFKYTDFQMRDWIWASSNNPLFMSDFVYTDRDTLETHSYADGGVTSYANLEYLINEVGQIDHIDVIFHNTKGVIRPGYNLSSGAIDRLLRILDMQSAEINKNDITNGQLHIAHPSNGTIGLTVYYMSDLDITTITGPSYNSLVFDELRMNRGVLRGYLGTKQGSVIKEECTISCKTGKINMV